MPKHVTYSGLFCLLLILLPLGGFLALPLGERGLRTDWILGALMGGLFFMGAALGRHRRQDLVLLAAIFLLHVGLWGSLYLPVTSGDPGRVGDWATTYVQFLVGALLFASVLALDPGRPAIDRILKTYVVVVAIVAAFGVVQFLASGVGIDLRPSFLNPGLRESHAGYADRTGAFSRASSIFEEPRQFASYASTGVLVAFTAGLFGFRLFRHRSTLLLVGAVCGAGLLASLSLSGIFVTVLSGASLGLFLLLRSGRGQLGIDRRYFAGAALVVVVVLAAAVLTEQQTISWFRNRFRVPDPGLLFRQITSMDVGKFGWLRYFGQIGLAIRLTAENPLFGVGLNSFERYGFGTFSGAFGLPRQFAETGLLGGTLTVLFFTVLLHRLTRAAWHASVRSGDRRARALAVIALVLGGTAILKTFATGLYGLQSNFLWAELALATLLCEHARRQWKGSAVMVDRAPVLAGSSLE